MTPACLEVAKAYYGQAIETLVPVSSAEAAEMVKLLENTFRAVNIGLVNEVALMCDRLGLDVWEIIDAAATKPFGFMKFYARPGPGRPLHSHRPALPLVEAARRCNYTARFIELASEINTNMPRVRGAEGAGCAQRARASRSRAAGCWCWAWPTSRMSPTCASRRPWM